MEVKIENAAAALADLDNLTLADARAYMDLCYRHKVALDQQVCAIKDPNESGEDRWSRTLATGTESDLEALQDEYKALKRDLERAQAQYGQFSRMVKVCREREAAASIPGYLADLEKKADAVTKARAALEKACRDLDNAYAATGQAYSDATRGQSGNADPQKPTEALINKLLATAKNAAYKPEGRIYGQAATRPDQVHSALHFADPVGLVPRPQLTGNSNAVQPGQFATGRRSAAAGQTAIDL